MDERRLAFLLLNRIERGGAYSNLTLDSALQKSGASPASRAFVTALVYGVLERRLTLDYLLSERLAKPLKKLRPEVLTVLRMGAYQLCFMDRIPAAAAVSESVALVRRLGCAYACGLVNSVLRKAGERGLHYPETGDRVYGLSVRFSCPEPLVRHFIRDYGIEDTEGFLHNSLERPRLTARVNTLRTTPAALIERLAREGVTASVCDEAPACLELHGAGSLRRLASFKEGLFHIQDPACVKVCEALSPEPDTVFMDVCAAPGGKSFTAAQMMGNRGRVLAFDASEERLSLIRRGAERLGIRILSAAAADASVSDPGFFGSADRVLCDVPCSGLGMIGKKPEIRYKDLAEIDNLPSLQYNILRNAAKYVKSGGLLAYSTCTLSRAENDAVCERFLKENSGFALRMPYRTLMPRRGGGEGFFFAVFGRD